MIGPGRAHLKYRRQVKEELVKKYRYSNKDIVIMEDVRDTRSDAGVDEKYERILRDFDPILAIAFFHKNARRDSVMFEIGFLGGFYGAKNLSDRLKILHELGFSFRNVSAYVKTLFPKINYAPFNDSNEYMRSAKLIDVFVGKTHRMSRVNGY